MEPSALWLRRLGKEIWQKNSDLPHNGGLLQHTPTSPVHVKLQPLLSGWNPAFQQGKANEGTPPCSINPGLFVRCSELGVLQTLSRSTEHPNQPPRVSKSAGALAANHARCKADLCRASFLRWLLNLKPRYPTAELRAFAS